MRFHLGCSFKPKLKLKWLLLLGIGLVGLLGNILIVDAQQIGGFDPTEVKFLDNNSNVNASYGISTFGYGVYWFESPYIVPNSYNNVQYTYSMNNTSTCSSTGNKANITFNTFVESYDNNNNRTGYMPIDYVLVKQNDIENTAICDTSNGYYECSAFIDLSRLFQITLVVPFAYQPVAHYNMGSVLDVTCDDNGVADIINNNNQNTQNIINNNNQNTQNIIDSQEATTDAVEDLNDNIMEEYDGSAGGHDFILPEFNYPSTIQGLFNLPIDLLRTIVNNSDTCTPYQIDFSSITRRWGGFDYTLTLPCLRAKLQSLLGFVYTLADYLLAFYIFYNIAMYILQLIDAITSGVDLFSYLYHSDSSNKGDTGYGHYNRDTGEVVD